MLGSLFEYIQEKSLLWDKEKSSDSSVTVETKVEPSNRITIYKTGKISVIQPEKQWDFLFSVEKNTDSFTLDFFLDPDTEEEIFNSLQTAKLELISNNNWMYKLCLPIKTEKEVIEFLEKHVWSHTPGLLY